MAPLTIRLLGGFEIETDGTPITGVQTPRLQSVLAYLLLHHAAPQSRRHVAFTIWPDSSERQALSNLRKTLYHLRRALSPDTASEECWLSVDGHHVQWRPAEPWSLDVFEFESDIQRCLASKDQDTAADRQAALEKAMAGYHGELLPGCYDDWITPRRQQLHHLYCQALEQLMTAAENQRDTATAMRAGQMLLAQDPLQETTYLHLMRLRMLEGNRGAALRTYHQCVNALRDELGVDPSAEFQVAYADLLNMNVPALNTQPAPTGETHVLVGRHAEWRTLRDAWLISSRKSPHFALIHGEAGIGKTRLAEELVTWVTRQGIPVAQSRGYESGRHLPYSQISELLSSDAFQEALGRLSVHQRNEIGRLTPALAATTSAANLTPPASPSPTSWANGSAIPSSIGLIWRHRR